MPSVNLSGWNFQLAGCVRRTSNLAVLASILAVPEHVIKRWLHGIELPTLRAVNAMRRYLADLDAPKVTTKRRERGPRGTVGAKKKNKKSRMSLRTAERPRFGYPKRLYTKKGWRHKGQG
jgi:hypothetical protein